MTTATTVTAARRRLLAGVAFVACMGLAPVLWAEPLSASHPLLARHEPGIGWQQLTPRERRVLRQHRPRWDSYDAHTQQRLRRGARRFLSLPPERRHELREQRQRYRRLPPEERRRLWREYRREHERR